MKKFFICLVNDRTRSLWIGTNSGHVYVYSIIGFEHPSINGPAIATDHTNACSLGMNLFFVILRFEFFILAKEIRLKHKAPVLSIIVLDGLNQSIGQGSSIPTIESTHSNSDTLVPTTNSENPTSHKVLICSEEQFKVKKKNLFLFYNKFHLS